MTVFAKEAGTAFSAAAAAAAELEPEPASAVASAFPFAAVVAGARVVSEALPAASVAAYAEHGLGLRVLAAEPGFALGISQQRVGADPRHGSCCEVEEPEPLVAARRALVAVFAEEP